MKNIYEILKGMGIELPADKKESFEKAFNENYKTVAEVDNLNKKITKAEEERDSYKKKYDTDIATRDTDLANLKKQLEGAGVDKTKLDELTTQLATLQTNYDNAKTEHQKQLIQQKKEFLIREKVGNLKFSSNSAKKTFLADVIAKDLPVDGDNILGFEDFVKVYKEQDAGAFVAEDDNNGAGGDGKQPKFSSKSGGSGKDDDHNPENNKPNRPIIW